LERRVELAALLGGAGERLEAGAQALDAGADSGVELRVALLLADQVGKDARALLDGAELELAVALDHLDERLPRPAESAPVGQRLAEESGRLTHEPHHLADDRGDQLVLDREIAVAGAGAELCLAEDVLHRRAVKALAGEGAQRRREDLAPASVDVLLGDLGHATSILALTENDRFSIKNESSFSNHQEDPMPP